MKKRLSVVLPVLAIAACQQTPPVVDSPAPNEGMPEKPQGYVALPGQAATSETPSETTTAFDFAAAAYAERPTTEGAGEGLPATSTPVTPMPEEAKIPESPLVAPPAIPKTIHVPENLPKAPEIPDPRPVEDRGLTPTAQNTEPPTQEVLDAPKPDVHATVSSPRGDEYGGYAVQVTNGTSGRLFVEMQDDSGNIFPFGFMYAGQRIATRPQTDRPIHGHLRVVVRDPDQPGAPELRRYNVEPPASYEGRTVGVTILPGGRYRASVDGEVYYRSPEPMPSLPE